MDNHMVNYVLNEDDLRFDDQLRQRIRAQMLNLPPELNYVELGNFEPRQLREMVDTSDLELASGAFYMHTITRNLCEVLVLLLSIATLIYLTLRDGDMIDEVRERVIPHFTLIDFSNSNNTLFEALKTSKVDKFTILLKFTVLLYAILSSVKLFLQLMNLCEDNAFEPKSNHRHSSCPLLVQYWMTLCLVIAIVGATYLSSFYLMKAAEYSNGTLSDMMHNYASGDLKLKRTVDLFQMQFECCGSVNYTDWYKLDLYQFPETFAELEPQDPLKQYFVAMFKAHYNLNDTVEPSLNDMEHFIDAHKGKHAKNVTIKGVASPLLQNYNQTIFPIESVPESCCKPMSRHECPFYNHHNLDNTWKAVNLNDFIFTEPCNEVVQNKLKHIGHTVGSINLIRLCWEFIYFLCTHIILHSFQSEWELNQMPSITSCPGALMWTFWFIVLIVYLNVACKFFSLRVLFGIY